MILNNIKKLKIMKNWTIEEIHGNLEFIYKGKRKMFITPDGKIYAEDVNLISMDKSKKL